MSTAIPMRTVNKGDEIEWAVAGGAAGAVLGHIVGQLAGFLVTEPKVAQAYAAPSLQQPFEGWEAFTDNQWEDFDALMQARKRQNTAMHYAGAVGGGVAAGLGAAHLAPKRLKTRVGIAAGVMGGIGYAIPVATRFWGPGFAAVGAYLGSFGGSP